MNSIRIQLKRNQEGRLKQGHCWVYSNEIDTAVTPLQGVEPGQPVDLVNHQQKWLGSGYLNPHSLIALRLVSRDPAHPLSQSLLVHRIKIALSLRERLYPGPYYRLIFGESDGLPGLVVDRYGDDLVVQIGTAGMERLRDEVVAALQKVLRPRSVILRNDSAVREYEGLTRYVEVAAGAAPEQLSLQENGLRFEVPALQGQKSGWFFDQAFNRARLAHYARECRVLDVCSYVGGWGVQAAAAGAQEVICIDSSRSALDGVGHNAELNGVMSRVSGLHGDAFDALKGLRAERQRFDIVLVDPPAFIKRRKDMKQGQIAYRRLNQAAMQLLTKDGILVSSSCSHHMSAENLLLQLQSGARHLDRSLQLLERGSQSPDHPIHPAIPETAYLKSFFLRVLPTF